MPPGEQHEKIGKSRSYKERKTDLIISNLDHSHKYLQYLYRVEINGDRNEYSFLSTTEKKTMVIAN